jgi:N-acetylglucosaminyldiphosphoundecaprenol N-acetyl-beta-D-mannosaminyltransferase
MGEERQRFRPSNHSIAILGVPFDNVSLADTIGVIEEMIASKKPHYIATANVDFLVQSMEDIELRRILFDADLVVCDGTPLVWVSRLLGNPLKERVAGSDLVPELLRVSAEKGHRVFFLGGQEEVLEAAVKNVREKHPDLKIAGHYSPPYAPLLEMDHEDICRRINETKPDICLVAFGCPKQEKWSWMNRGRLDVPMSVGVGATIDFLAGNIKRAPKWIGLIGMEWFYRMLQEPKRLVKRYAKDLWVFGFGILRQIRELRRRIGVHKCSRKAKGILREEFYWLELPLRLDTTAVKTQEAIWEAAVHSDRRILLVSAGVKHIDSTGTGLLVRLAKMAREQQVVFILVGVSKAVLNALELMQIQDLFHMTEKVADALVIGRERLRELEAPTERTETAGEIARRIAWKGEVTAANVGEVWDHTERALNDAESELIIDLAAVRFIDSSGAGLMVKVKKAAVEKRIEIEFRDPGKEVLNVLRMTRLEKFLLGKS